ncbi:MAG: hypothetical protein IT454_18605 [Planctomycetes bacterium]|nr:hypothetical protein [Planctomycetota bacterium]
MKNRSTALALLPLLTPFLATPAAAAPNDVGSPVIDRPLNDSSVGLVLLYLGPTQPLSGPGFVQNWSFFDNEGLAGKVTPIVFEQTGTTQWTVVAIGTSRTNTGAGAQTHPFATIAGITSFDPAKHYTVGFTHRGYTGTGPNIVADNGFGGIVDFTGYNIFTDRWAYTSGTLAIGTILGTGGLALDWSGLGGRIYSASFQANAGQGWTNYCTAGTSTNGCTPTIVAVGSPSVSQSSGFNLRVLNLEGQKQGLVFYGLNGSAISPWSATSTSFLCVKAPTQRMSSASSGGTVNQCDGTFSTDWLQFVASTPGALGVPFASGTTVHAQAWYRDPPAPKTTNLSNAIQFVTVP